MSLFLGVDGGNTKTLAVVADETGRVLGTGRAGNGDIYGAASPEEAMAAVADAVSQACATAGSRVISHAAYSIAGADWPEDYAYIEDQLRRFSDQILVVNDSYGALRAGTKDGIGLAVICGTAGTAGAVSKSGKRWQGGFWHRGESGGVSLSQAVVNKVLDAELGIVPSTTLTKSVLEFYGENSVPEMLHRFTRRNGAGRPGEGALTPILFEAANAGDEVAMEIVKKHGVRQGRYAIAAARYVGLTGAFPFVLAGGVLRFTPNPLEPWIVETVLAAFPEIEPARPRFEPLFGGLMLAYDQAGIEITPDVEWNLAESGPDSEFFRSLA